jgi:uncharacterized protein Yka (UPF0111/DUF47 family)
MSVDFGCIETCIFPDFEDYVERTEEHKKNMNIMLNKNKFLPLHREKWLYMYA